VRRTLTAVRSFQSFSILFFFFPAIVFRDANSSTRNLVFSPADGQINYEEFVKMMMSK
jgi:hypothetical protein